MDEEAKEYFRDDDNVKHELLEARNAFNTNTSFEQFDALLKGLTIMSLYCSDKMQSMVIATINEAHFRQLYSV